MRLSHLFLLPLAFSTLAEAAVLDLGTLGGDYSFARDINQDGLIIGEAKTVSGDTHAFIWEKGLMKDLGTFKKQRYSMANGMNNKGEVVGYGRDKTVTGQTKALLWDAKGVVRELSPLKAGDYAQASELNDKGQIVGVSGTKAVLWKTAAGKPSSLPSLGGDYSIALGINNAGSVIGNSLTSDGQMHATLWVNGKATDLGTLGGRFSTANGINDAGDVVGTSETPDGTVHAFLWQKGKMQDLGPGMIRSVNRHGNFAGELAVTAESSFAVAWPASTSPFALEQLDGTRYSSGFALNDAGSIVGVSEIPREDGVGTEFRATLWSE